MSHSASPKYISDELWSQIELMWAGTDKAILCRFFNLSWQGAHPTHSRAWHIILKLNKKLRLEYFIIWKEQPSSLHPIYLSFRWALILDSCFAENKPMKAEAEPIDVDARDPVEGRLVSELLKIRAGVKIGKKKPGILKKKLQKKIARHAAYPV